MTIIGIDPGKNGGIAWIRGGDVAVEKMPDTLKDLWDLFEHIMAETPMIYRQKETFAVIEQVASSSQMGVKSAFTFGQGYGRLEMALTAANVPFKRVTPQVWQKSMKCLTGGNKNVSKGRAQELFPSLKITHSTADALLIAEYARITI
jgi:Holliday junction resolvasome RuvABC endonuclease subunit